MLEKTVMLEKAYNNDRRFTNEDDFDKGFSAEYSGIIPKKEYPCLQRLLRELSGGRKKNLVGKKVLINCHMTLSVLILIDVFIAAGIDVKWTRADELVEHSAILSVVQNKNMYLDFNEIKKNIDVYREEFDVVLDCGGYLANLLSPKKGFIELTHVEEDRYQNTNRPTINIDSSMLKYIETSFGTGDGFFRSMRKLAVANLWDMFEKNYIIFGFGKVGYGIVSRLVKNGISKDKITVIDKDENAISRAKSIGILAHNIEKEYEKVCHKIKKSHCAVTATGITGVMSKYFSAKQFNHMRFLVNMGTNDEWGERFSSDSVLYGKKPLNFNLEFPTRVIYLDPVFSLMFRATEQMLASASESSFSVYSIDEKIGADELEYFLSNSTVGLTKEDVQDVARFFH